MTALERRPQPELATLDDWLGGTHVPLDVAQALSEDQLAGFAGWLAQHERYGDAVRWAVGAALHKRRGDFKRGDWTPYVAGLADRLGLKTATLGRWMTEAEAHYELGPPKGANPGRRGPLPGRRPPKHASDASSDEPAPELAPAVEATAVCLHPGCGRPAERVAGKWRHADGRFRHPVALTAPPEPEPAEDPPAPSASLAGPRRVVCPRCAGAGTLPAPEEEGRNAPDTARLTCRHPRRKALGYITVCADCGANLSGR